MAAYMSSPLSSDADDSEGKSSAFCYMHTANTHGRVLPFSEKSFNKFKECAELWKELKDRPESGIAVQADGLEFNDVCKTNVELEGGSDRTTNVSRRKRQGRAGYHTECYRHFCNLTAIRRGTGQGKESRDFNRTCSSSSSSSKKPAGDIQDWRGD